MVTSLDGVGDVAEMGEVIGCAVLLNAFEAATFRAGFRCLLANSLLSPQLSMLSKSFLASLTLLGDFTGEERDFFLFLEVDDT